MNPTPSIYALAGDFVSRCIECERTFLTALWLDGFTGTNAAMDAGLRGSDFLIPAHAVVFAYLCTRAERNLSPSVADCVLVARAAGVQLSTDRPFPCTDGRLFLYSDILAPHLDEVREDQGAFYAESVRDYALKRREAQEAFRRYRHILVSDILQKRRVSHAA